jgi:hypothetical protein
MFIDQFFQMLGWFDHRIENKQKTVDASGWIAIVRRCPMVRAAVHAFFALYGFVLRKVYAAVVACHHV